MKAALMPHGRYYKITLTRTEARIEVDLRAAEPECPDYD